MDVPNSAVLIAAVDLTVSVNSSLTGATADSVLAALQSDLVADGFTIAQKSVGLSGVTFPLTGEFSATLQIMNQSGQDAEDTDVQASFQTACDDNGVQLNSFGALQVVGGSTGTNSGTGAAGNVLSTSGAGNAQGGQSTSGTPQCGDPALTFWKYPQQFIQCITNKGLTTVGLLAIGLLVGIVLIVFMERRPTPI
jgi:hypothetical protein